jgi:serine/threonine protein kinase
MCADSALFLQDHEGCNGFESFLQISLILLFPTGNLDEENMLALYYFDDEFKHYKLSKISDALARNLVAQMLTKDPSKRPNTSQILSHPFLSGR